MMSITATTAMTSTSASTDSGIGIGISISGDDRFIDSPKIIVKALNKGSMSILGELTALLSPTVRTPFP